MLKKSAIGFFDSGVGQLSVLVQVKKLLPKESYAVFADQKNMPFGNKTQRQLILYASNAIKKLQKNHRIKAMVIACNTASVSTLDALRRKFQIPIVGVVPAIKPASETTKNGKIAVFSTVTTAKSPYLENLVQKFAKDKKVLKIACPHLATAIETANFKLAEKLVKKYTMLATNFGADTAVLGCTHYPLVASLFKKYLAENVQIVDSAQGIAKRVKAVLPQINDSQKANDAFYTTGNAKMFSKVASDVLKYKVDAKPA